MRQPLTARQREALDYISYCIEERGYPPTFREIGEHMGIRSTNGVGDHIKALERKGYLVREEFKSRSLRIVDNSKVTIPIMAIGAGRPIFAEENVIDRVTVDRFFIGKAPAKDVFGMEVRGYSMIDDGIHDGDIVFVRNQATAENGETVVAMLEGAATCMRIYYEGDRVRLQPANTTMVSVYVHRSEFRALNIVGKVVGVYRRMH